MTHSLIWMFVCWLALSLSVACGLRGNSALSRLLYYSMCYSHCNCKTQIIMWNIRFCWRNIFPLPRLCVLLGLVRPHNMCGQSIFVTANRWGCECFSPAQGKRVLLIRPYHTHTHTSHTRQVVINFWIFIFGCGCFNKTETFPSLLPTILLHWPGPGPFQPASDLYDGMVFMCAMHCVHTTNMKNYHRLKFANQNNG